MAMMKVKHEGGMSSSINVRNHKVMVDVPVAMGGQDKGPTPVDLLAGSLGSCVALYVARWCRDAGVPYEGLEVDVDYVHDRETHCVPVLSVRVRMPEQFPKEREEALLRVAQSCTIHNTLCTIPEITIEVAGENE